MNLFQHFKNNIIFKNILLLASGTVVVQLLNFLCYPLISRLYLPEAFGVFATFTSIFSILEPATCLRLEAAIVLPKSQNIAFKVLILSFITSVFYCTIVFLGLLIFDQNLIAVFNLHDVEEYILFIPFSLLGAGLFKALMAWNIRKKTFKNVVRSQVQQVLYKNITQISLGFLKFGPIGLVLGFFISQITGLVVLIRSSYKFFLQRLRFLSKGRLLLVLKKYANFPRLSAPSAFLNALGLYLPTPFLSFIYGPEVAGFFAFSVVVIATPFRVLGQAIAQVYLSEGAELYRNSNQRITSVFNKLLNRLLLAGVAPLLLFFFLGESIFGIVFGAKWVLSGEMTKYLVFTYYAQFISTSVSQILNIIGKQKVLLFWDILRLILMVFGFTIIWAFDMKSIHAVIILSACMTTAYLILSLLCRKYLKTLNLGK